jgi:transcriptional regulator with GAF, ATPase, and Fis domain
MVIFLKGNLMNLSKYLHFSPSVPEVVCANICKTFNNVQPDKDVLSASEKGFCAFFFDQFNAEVIEQLKFYSNTATVLAITLKPLDTRQMWELLRAGANDLLLWSETSADVEQICSRCSRWQLVQQLAESNAVKNALVGTSKKWLALVRSVVEVAAFTDASVLITGETGTGKELIARLIHQLDPQQNKGELVIVDCTTLATELSGSEFFGHDRGAFTGAANKREGAFSLANGGLLLLDEVGELSLAHQAQLLRVIQEKKYKRIGSNAWQSTNFRLVCATNRDLEAEVVRGNFRADLFYRIAGWRCRTPALRERQEDILPLAQHFLKNLAGSDVDVDVDVDDIEMDQAVREYFLTREYPGNVRDLRQTVTRVWHRHCSQGPLTIGDIPPDERTSHYDSLGTWPDSDFENSIRHAVIQGIGLKEISRIASDMAMNAGLDQENGNVQRAAIRLGVTDRALQLRLASRRTSH